MKSILSKSGWRFIIFLFILAHSAISFSLFDNYTSAIKINDILINDTLVWAATTGGLMRIVPSEGIVQLQSNTENFPDLNCTALCKDINGNLWVGTRNGYLYEISNDNKHSTYISYISSKSYNPSGWPINKIISFKHYLIIGSSSGCSIFNTENKEVEKNAYGFGDFRSPVVNSMAIHNDTLYLGCDNGVAKLDISGEKLITTNFTDVNIWETEDSENTIMSIPVFKDSIRFVSEIASVWNNSLLHAVDIKNTDDTEQHLIYKNGTMLCEFSSKVISIAGENSGECWFGTEQDYLYRWDGSDLQQYRAEGLPFRFINRVMVTRNGTVWCIPKICYYDNPWWEGIISYNGDNWFFYSPYITPNFGDMGDGISFLGIAEDREGNIWFGNNGNSIKKYNIKEDSWSRYRIGHLDYAFFYLVPEGGRDGWAKCDAIAQDSSGYMWFAAYENNNGCVICYDPTKEEPGKSDYRYLFEKDSPYHIDQPISINVDVKGSIFIGGSGFNNGRLTVFSHNGEPLNDNQINNNACVYNNYDKIWDIASASDTSTWIATGKGLYQYKGEGNLIKVDIDSLTWISSSKGLYRQKDETPLLNIVTIEVESHSVFRPGDIYGNHSYGDSARFEYILWSGTSADGLMRLVAHVYVDRNGKVSSTGVDSIQYFTESEGLISDMINHISMDRENGFLWIATAEGLSRYNIGHSFKKLKTHTKISVYPNPFSHSRNKEMIFENIVPFSSISIYTVDGRLIEDIVDRGSNVRKTANEWTYLWKPDTDLVPGTYFYAAKKQVDEELWQSKAIIGKLMILP